MVPGAPRDASWSVILRVRVSTGGILRAAANGLNRRKPWGLGVHAHARGRSLQPCPHTLPSSVAEESPRNHSSPRTPYTNRVRLERVPPAYTSQRCHVCGHTERGNRKGEVFCCRHCGFTGNADVNAAKNLLIRFWGREPDPTGPYGA
ncbi:MAG: zinc ribbon domain-containing protein, partial [Thermoplasmata archaeon]